MILIELNGIQRANHKAAVIRAAAVGARRIAVAAFQNRARFCIFEQLVERRLRRLSSRIVRRHVLGGLGIARVDFGRNEFSFNIYGPLARL